MDQYVELEYVISDYVEGNLSTVINLTEINIQPTITSITESYKIDLELLNTDVNVVTNYDIFVVLSNGKTLRIPAGETSVEITFDKLNPTIESIETPTKILKNLDTTEVLMNGDMVKLEYSLLGTMETKTIKVENNNELTKPTEPLKIHLNTNEIIYLNTEESEKSLEVDTSKDVEIIQVLTTHIDSNEFKSFVCKKTNNSSTFNPVFKEDATTVPLRIYHTDKGNEILESLNLNNGDLLVVKDEFDKSSTYFKIDDSTRKIFNSIKNIKNDLQKRTII